MSRSGFCPLRTLLCNTLPCGHHQECVNVSAALRHSVWCSSGVSAAHGGKAQQDLRGQEQEDLGLSLTAVKDRCPRIDFGVLTNRSCLCRLEEEGEEDEEEDGGQGKAAAPADANGTAAEPAEVWLPVALGLGLPLTPDKLCAAVCGRAGASNFLEVRSDGAPLHTWSCRSDDPSRPGGSTACPSVTAARARVLHVSWSCHGSGILERG